jgi:hypothetical protein
MIYTVGISLRVGVLTAYVSIRNTDSGRAAQHEDEGGGESDRVNLSLPTVVPIKTQASNRISRVGPTVLLGPLARGPNRLASIDGGVVE